MLENKKLPSEGQSEGSECAGARVEGKKEYVTPSQIVYHGDSRLSTPYGEIYNPRYLGAGIPEKKCIWCGKNFIPTRPEYAWDDCCSYTCLLRYEENRKQQGISEKVVMMTVYDRRELIMFDSAENAAEYVGVTKASIRDACNGRTKTCKGYAWRWAEVGKTEILKK